MQGKARRQGVKKKRRAGTLIALSFVPIEIQFASLDEG
jgi:hypothetical protein